MPGPFNQSDLPFLAGEAATLLQPPNVASGAGFDPASWFSAQSMDAAMNVGFVDGQDGPTTWKDLGTDAHDASKLHAGVGDLVWRKTGGPGGKPAVDFVHQPAGGSNTSFCYNATFANQGPISDITACVIFKSAAGALPGPNNERMLLGSGAFLGGDRFQIEAGRSAAGVSAFRGAVLNETTKPTYDMSAFGGVIVEFVNGAGGLVRFTDGTTSFDQTGSTGPDLTYENLQIGNFEIIDADFGWLGLIEDIVIYKGIGGALRSQLTAYANNKIAGL